MTTAPLVLHIEDNDDNRLLLRRLLLVGGYRLSEAVNAKQALEILEQEKPDLILMDINMPGVDGYSLTHRLKSMPDYKNIPIIAVTANVMKGDREKSLLAGCNGYIEKPIDVDLFLDKVADFLK